MGDFQGQQVNLPEGKWEQHPQFGEFNHGFDIVIFDYPEGISMKQNLYRLVCTLNPIQTGI